MAEIRMVVYLDPEGRSTFTRWFDELNAEAAARVTTALYRLGQGNFSNVEGVGSGVFEYRIEQVLDGVQAQEGAQLGHGRANGIDSGLQGIGSGACPAGR